MQLIINVIIFLAGFALLAKGANSFVKSASIIAKKIGISEFIIGLTLVAIGTSLPELASTIIASLKGQSGIVLGQVIGSNIANIGIIGLIVLVFGSIEIKKEMVKRDGYIMVFTMILFVILAFNHQLGKITGIIFLSIFIIYFLFIIDTKKKTNKKYFSDFVKYFIEFKYLKSIKKKISRNQNQKSKKNISKEILVLVLSGIAIFIGAKAIVEQTIFFGDYFNISKTIISLTVIALGTSLPELGVTISAIKNKMESIAVGNIIGSSIANILLIIGVSSIISPIQTNPSVIYTGIFMIFISAGLLITMAKDWKIKRYEGAILFALYILFIISIIFFRKGF